ncbi:MAG: DUF4956 domain-containing protein [Lachnospiraceae bacterium]|nr:DUF4956 domain-containing protein [Lachnospiraceae bacterium]
MSFQDAIKKSVLEGFSSQDIPTSQIVVVLGITFLIGLYIYFIYKLANRTAMYDKTFHNSMALISVITAGIIVAMQSSIVISLGMVGALSIVRFRTAIKSSMDLMFLFWSIGEGIICGAGLFKVAVIVALIITVGIFVLEYMPGSRRPLLLIVNSESVDSEDEIVKIVAKTCKSYKVKSRNLKKNGFDIILEVYSKEEKSIVSEISSIDSVVNVSLLAHDGEVRI